MHRRLAIGIGTAAAVLAAGGGVAVLVWPTGSDHRSKAAEIISIPPDLGAKPPAVRAAIEELDLAAHATRAGGVDLPQRTTRPFSMLSVSWTDPAARPHGTVQVRTRSAATGRWSGWQPLGASEEAADRPAEAARAHGATDPLWAGRSNGVAARIVVADATTTALPAGLSLNLIDPDSTTGGQGGQGGGETDPSAAPSASDPSTPSTEPSESVSAPASEIPTAPTVEPVPSEPVPSGTPQTPPPTTTAAPPGTTPPPAGSELPPYVSRIGWNADETLVKYPVDVAPAVKMVWVHHTGFGNNYTCADSASVIRGIQANDVLKKSLDDIGYNFLVDPCGTLFEGRRGGVANAVIGAHTVGFNTGSLGIALLGDYTTAKPTAEAEATIAKVAAARLGAYGFSPTSTVQMTEGVTGRVWPIGSTVTFPRIAGHKDGERYWTNQANGTWGYLTECPGLNFYPELDTIRAMTRGLSATSFGGAQSADGTYHVGTAVTVSWSVARPPESVARIELLRDGAVTATLPGTARSGTYALTPGAHAIWIRAVDVSGVNAITPRYRVFADVTAPTFPVAPTPTLRGGTYSTTYAPVTLNYRAADNARVWTVTASRPSAANLSPTGTAWSTGMRPGLNTVFTLTARDVAGNARSAAVTRKATLLAETSAKRGGRWAARSSGAYLGGRALAATGAKARLTYTFTGRSAALLVARGPKTGKAYVYLDGKKVATIDTRSGASTYRQAIWVRALTAGRHTVALVVAGTARRPTVVSDGLAYIG